MGCLENIARSLNLFSFFCFHCIYHIVLCTYARCCTLQCVQRNQVLVRSSIYLHSHLESIKFPNPRIGIYFQNTLFTQINVYFPKMSFSADKTGKILLCAHRKSMKICAAPRNKLGKLGKFSALRARKKN